MIIEPPPAHTPIENQGGTYVRSSSPDPPPPPPYLGNRYTPISGIGNYWLKKKTSPGFLRKSPRDKFPKISPFPQ